MENQFSSYYTKTLIQIPIPKKKKQKKFSQNHPNFTAKMIYEEINIILTDSNDTCFMWCELMVDNEDNIQYIYFFLFLFNFLENNI